MPLWVGYSLWRGFGYCAPPGCELLVNEWHKVTELCRGRRCAPESLHARARQLCTSAPLAPSPFVFTPVIPSTPPHRHESFVPAPSLCRRNLTFDLTSTPFTALDSMRHRLRASCLLPLLLFCTPRLPSHTVSLSTLALSFWFPLPINMSCVPRSPILLVRLHLVPMFPVLPFRSLQVSGMYVT